MTSRFILILSCFLIAGCSDCGGYDCCYSCGFGGISGNIKEENHKIAQARSASLKKNKAKKKVKKSNVPDYSGLWTVVLNKSTTTTCNNIPASLLGVARVNQSRTSARVVVPGYATLNGAVSAEGVKATGSYSYSAKACTAKINLRLKGTKDDPLPRTAVVTGTVDLTCKDSACRIVMNGRGRR